MSDYADRKFGAPSRELIAARMQPPGTANGDDGLDGVVTRPEPETEGDALAWFGAHVRAALRVRGWSKGDLARKTGAAGADVTRASNGTACGLALAGKIAAALGRPLAEMITPLTCENCTGRPPAGFACMECGAEGARTGAGT